MDDRWKRNPDVIATDLDDELVLLNPRTRAVFTLNETGRLIWNQLDVPCTAAHVAYAVTEAFTVDLATATDDARRLLAVLAGAGLVER